MRTFRCKIPEIPDSDRGGPSQNACPSVYDMVFWGGTRGTRFKVARIAAAITYFVFCVYVICFVPHACFNRSIDVCCACCTTRWLHLAVLPCNVAVVLFVEKTMKRITRYEMVRRNIISCPLFMFRVWTPTFNFHIMKIERLPNCAVK